MDDSSILLQPRVVQLLYQAVVHNQLLCFADSKMEAFILAPRCQGSEPLHLVVTGDHANDGHVVGKLDGGGTMASHTVMHKQRAHERTQP